MYPWLRVLVGHTFSLSSALLERSTLFSDILIFIFSLFSAVARGTCTAIMYPMDLIKTRIQVDHPNPFQLIGLFDGVGGSLLGVSC
jgi:hypothetical protein